MFASTFEEFLQLSASLNLKFLQIMDFIFLSAFVSLGLILSLFDFPVVRVRPSLPPYDDCDWLPPAVDPRLA